MKTAHTVGLAFAGMLLGGAGGAVACGVAVHPGLAGGSGTADVINAGVAAGSTVMTTVGGGLAGALAGTTAGLVLALIAGSSSLRARGADAPLAPWVCPRCSADNPGTQFACGRCRFSLV